MLYQNRLEIAAGTARELATRLTALGYRLIYLAWLLRA